MWKRGTYKGVEWGNFWLKNARFFFPSSRLFFLHAVPQPSGVTLVSSILNLKSDPFFNAPSRALDLLSGIRPVISSEVEGRGVKPSYGVLGCRIFVFFPTASTVSLIVWRKHPTIRLQCAASLQTFIGENPES